MSSIIGTTSIAISVLGVHIRIGTYATMLTIGAAAGIALALWLVHARGLGTLKAAIVYGTSAACIPLGSRLLIVATDRSLFPSASAALSPTLEGLALYGGLILAMVVGSAVAVVLKTDIWRLADCAAPGIALGLVCARMGCFAVGCCHGVVTTNALGVTYGLGSPAHGSQLLAGTSGLLGPVAAVWPTQLFELTGAAVFGIVAYFVGRQAASGMGFLVLAIGFTLTRLVVYPFRWIEPSFSASHQFYPVLYVCIIVLCSGLLVWRVRKG